MSKKYMRIALIGHFGGGQNFLDGQTIKTKVLHEELSRVENIKIKTADTYYSKRNIIKFCWDLLVALIRCKHIVLLVAENGMKKLFPILYICSKFFGKRIYHSVIGASLAERVVSYPKFKKYLNSFAVNWCETKGLVEKLHSLGVENAVLMYNCKRLVPVSIDDVSTPINKPYKLCVFSRVMREKGIEDAIYAVKAINDKYAQTIYTLDIYGQVDANQTEWFDELQSSFPEYISYGGLVPFDKSVEVLKNYFALLFPTRYKTEGVPGTIIDAYAAGLPVIASKWENFDNIIDEKTGIGYEFNNVDELVGALDEITKNVDVILDKKKNCISRYNDFSPDTIIKLMLRKIGEKS